MQIYVVKLSYESWAKDYVKLEQAIIRTSEGVKDQL